jgi:hypothetical protein
MFYMQYALYLKYETIMPIGLNGYWGSLCEETFADIMYWTDEENADKEYDKDEGFPIGIFGWVNYNQTLAKLHNVNMTHVPFLSMYSNGKSLFDLDYANISHETIDEIGAASNSNIVIIRHFGISAAYRNKGLGEEVLKGFIEQMKGKCGYIVITNNEPAQLGKHNHPYSLYVGQGVELDNLEKDPEKAQWKLNAFWQRCGFRQFKNYDNVFICNVDQAVPNHRKAKAPSTI